jgi:DNA invertase Pin-like site-specific DNA recombinase
LILIFDDKVANLKEQIWEALKNNKDSTYIGEKLNYNTNHQCTLIETVKFINKDSKSVVKRAPLPYPENYHMAVGYTRVSTDRQVAEGHSLDAQEAFLAKEAGIRNYFLRALYIDEGISGKDIEHREALKKMMEELQEGDKVIVYAVERFTRHLKDLLVLAEEIKRKKCVLIVPEMDVDFNTPQGGMLLAIRGSLAQYEREITSKRVKDTLGHLKRMGRLANKPHFGMMINPDKSPDAPLYIRNEEEQKLIDKIRNLRAKHKDLKITAFTRLVNEKIDPPRTATTWYHKMLKDVMAREGIK